MAGYDKPLPRPTIDSKPYWDGLKKHELLIQRCHNCGSYRHYPRPMCPKCHSFDVEWARVSGKGRVYTWATSFRAFHPSFAAEVPYATVTIELDEGVRLVSRILDVKPEELQIGMRVEVVFVDVTAEVTLAMFKRVR